MDKLEAAKILSQHVGRLTSYDDLVPLVESKHVERLEAVGASSVKYKIEVRFFWQDNAIKRNIRVAGSIAEYTRGSVPLTQTLLVPPPESAI
jgi:hypothetical protein